MNAQPRPAGEGTRSIVAIVLTVLIPFGMGFYLSNLFRTVNAVIAPRLIAEVGLSAAELGLLTSAYFVTFALVQLPIGVALDRFGPRRVQAFLLCVAAAGTLGFAFGDSFLTLTIARALTGIGTAGCLMTALTANAQWWPPARLALVNNLTAAFGSFGALTATAPLQLLLSWYDWRTLFVVLAGVIALMVLIVLAVVPREPARESRAASVGQLVSGLRRVFADRFFWRLGFLVLASQGTYLAYITLWAGPWLRDVSGFGPMDAANRLLLIQLGMFAGVVTLGIAADRMRRRGFQVVHFVALGALGFIGVQLSLVLDLLPFPALQWAVFGVCGSINYMSFALVSEYFPRALTGRAVSALNMLVFVCAFAAQWAIGLVINLWPEVTPGHYDPDGHRAALWAMIGLQTVALAYFSWPRRVAGRARSVAEDANG